MELVNSVALKERRDRRPSLGGIFPHGFVESILWEEVKRDWLALLMLCDVTQKFMHMIRRLAKDGNRNAAVELSKLAIIATEDLNKIVCESPRSFKDVAKWRFSWPVMRSPYRNFRDQEPNWRKVGLGGAFHHFGFSKRAVFKPRDDVGRLAFRLWHHVNRLREYTLTLNPSRLEREAWFDSCYLGGHGLGGVSGKCLTDARALPDFGPKSEIVERWFNVATLCLIAACHKKETPDLLDESHPLLNRMVTTAKHRKSPKALRGRILYNLGRKFFSLAGLDQDYPVAPSPR